jgi:CHAT domain-containing protein
VKARWFDPIRPALTGTGPGSGVRRLIVTGRGGLAAAPIELLASDHLVSYAPCATHYARLRRDPVPVAIGPMLTVADPAFAAERELPGLAGTRTEAEALRAVVGDKGVLSLFGTAASEEGLRRLADKGALETYRVLHLATLPRVDRARPLRSTLALAGEGRLEAAAIVENWRLKADVVTLSVAAEAEPAGLSGALLAKGARAVLWSRWKTDATATALLLTRFYENVLGRRDRLAKALPRAEALAEAKAWLRGLTRRDAADRAEGLTGERVRAAVVLPPGERPFANPHYWAGVSLIGDPD